MEYIPNCYFYSAIPFIVAALLMFWAALKTKDEELWGRALVTLAVGITPLNTIILGIGILLLLVAAFISVASKLVSLIFKKLTK